MSGESMRDALFFAKYRIWRPAALPYYDELMRNQYLSRDELEHVNWQKRKRLLAYAAEHVPFYRDRFRRLGLRPDGIARPEDYRHVPVLTREDLREHFRELISEEAPPGRLKLSTTGGSTGEPVKVCFDRRSPAAALGWRMMSWWGLGPATDAAILWREARGGAAGRLLRRALWWPAARVHLDASSMRPEDVRRFLRKCNALRPPLLHGYVGAVDHLASFAEENGIDLWQPMAVWVTSSPTSAVQRQRIERAFRAPVYDQYGCCEVYWLSAQCRERGGLHVFADARCIELTDDDGSPLPAGQVGNVVVTDLENTVFPLIRYANGDRGRALEGTCPCGRTLPLMDEVRGRQADLVRLPDGACISGEYLTTLFDDFPEVVRGFQVRQRADLSIRVLYVPSASPEALAAALARVERQLIARTGAQVPVALEAVDRIPHERGKLRFVISDAA